MADSTDENALRIVFYKSQSFANKRELGALLEANEVLFESKHFGYVPFYNLISLTAWAAQKMGIKHSVDITNIFKLPSQVYVIKARDSV